MFETGDLIRFVQTDVVGTVVGFIKYTMNDEPIEYVQVLSSDIDCNEPDINSFPIEYFKLVARRIG